MPIWSGRNGDVDEVVRINRGVSPDIETKKERLLPSTRVQVMMGACVRQYS